MRVLRTRLLPRCSSPKKRRRKSAAAEKEPRIMCFLPILPLFLATYVCPFSPILIIA